MTDRKRLMRLSIDRGIDMDPRTKVSIRDFVIFQLKLLIDASKDTAVFTVSFFAFAAVNGAEIVINKAAINSVYERTFFMTLVLLRPNLPRSRSRHQIDACRRKPVLV